MPELFIDIAYLIGALLIAVWFFGSLLPALLGSNKYHGEDDLPLDMIYKSKEEVAEYRKLHNIKHD